MSKPAWPKVVTRGHTTVKIYKTPSNGSDQFTVSYYLGDKRVRKTFSDSALALTEAETVANKLSTGELKVLELRNEDRLSYVRAMEAIAATGIPLEMAALHFAEAFRILGGDKLVEAARFYAKHHPDNMPKKNVPVVVDELLTAKEADGLSDVYLKDLRGRLGRFKKRFTGRISEINAGDIDGFLRDLKAEDRKGKVTGSLSATSRNNYRRAIGTLLNFAEARGYLPKGVIDIESVAIAKRKHADIEIFSPAEMARVLDVANRTTPNLIPFLAIGAFAGLRHAEIQRLDWSEVRFDEAFIEVKASKAKTASRRLVPITDNLRAWIASHRKEKGPVCPYASMSKQLMWLAESVDKEWKEENFQRVAENSTRGARDPQTETMFEWKHNALRHSFISYRVADIQNVAQVALEAGNSPRMVFSNYRELVRPADAKKWFSIVPEKAENVIEITQDGLGETDPKQVTAR